MVDRKSSQTKTFSQNMIYMFCLSYFSVEKKKYLQPYCPLNDALPGPYVPVPVTHSALVTHQYTYVPPAHLTAEPWTTAELLFPSQCPSGMNFLTPCSMVWDWQVSRAGSMFIYWPKQHYPDFNLLLFVSFLPVYRLVLWGWRLRTDRVYITLSQPCTADLF